MLPAGLRGLSCHTTQSMRLAHRRRGACGGGPAHEPKIHKRASQRAAHRRDSWLLLCSAVCVSTQRVPKPKFVRKRLLGPPPRRPPTRHGCSPLYSEAQALTAEGGRQRAQLLATMTPLRRLGPAPLLLAVLATCMLVHKPAAARTLVQAAPAASLAAAPAAAAAEGSQADAQLLLAFKASLESGNEILQDWRPGTDPCAWTGISCKPDGSIDSL